MDSLGIVNMGLGREIMFIQFIRVYGGCT